MSDTLFSAAELPLEGNENSEGFQYLADHIYKVTRDVGLSLREFQDVINVRSKEEIIWIQDSNYRPLRPIEIPGRVMTRITARNVLENLSIIAPSIGLDLGLRVDFWSDLPFRLAKLYQSSPSIQPALAEDHTFIALSYCWRASDQGLSLPISTFMFNALLAERISPSEGIWIDQLCINQSDEAEKQILIGSMDLIYNNARLVVIVLEDIVVTETEENVLQCLLNKSERGESWDIKAHDGVALTAMVLLWKIFSARWFTRAWCNHEFRVGQNHVFLIKVEDQRSHPLKVLRFTTNFLMELADIDSSYCTYRRPIDDQYLSLKTSYEQRATYFARQVHLIDSSKNIPADSAYMKSFMTTFLEISALESKFDIDKLAITLNVADCGLYFKGSTRTKDECCLTLSMLALAAGDPTVLCNCGRKLWLPVQYNAQSWMRWPRQDDIDGTPLRRMIHRRITRIPSFSQEEIVLDLLIMGNETILHYASESFITQATWFVDGCTEIAPERGSWLGEYWEPGLAIDTSMRDWFIKALACSLECGRSWFGASVAAKFSVQSMAKSIALVTEGFECFFGPDAQAQTFKDCYENYEQSHASFGSFDQFFSCLRGWLPSVREPTWVPAWIPTGSGANDRSLILCPTNGRFTIGIPELLSSKEYTNFNRIFLLEKVIKEEAGDIWKILNKTMSFDAGDFTALAQSEYLHKNQTIQG